MVEQNTPARDMCSLMDIVDQFESEGYGGFEENKNPFT